MTKRTYYLDRPGCRAGRAVAGGGMPGHAAAHAASRTRQRERPAAQAPSAPTPGTTIVEVDRNVGDMSTVGNIVIDRGMSEVAQECIDCHKITQPGHHQCLEVTAATATWASPAWTATGSRRTRPMATQHETLIGTDIYVSALVSPTVCGRCHPVEQAAVQRERSLPRLPPDHPQGQPARAGAEARGAESSRVRQRHRRDRLYAVSRNGDQAGRREPARLSSTWPNMGMGNIYPDGSTGSCNACHTRHLFSIAEARKPTACASCHLGPDHPDIEIFENSKHGHIFLAEGDDWNWDAAPDAWEPGDYRGPTCATCHMSGIGELHTTHNISERLYWNLWAKRSEVRNSSDRDEPAAGRRAGRSRDDEDRVQFVPHVAAHGQLLRAGRPRRAALQRRLLRAGREDARRSWRRRDCSRRIRGWTSSRSSTTICGTMKDAAHARAP